MRTLLTSLILFQAQENHEQENMYELNPVNKDSNSVPDSVHAVQLAAHF